MKMCFFGLRSVNQKMARAIACLGMLGLAFFPIQETSAQDHFNAWLTTCSHLIGPTGNPNSFKKAVKQSKGLDQKAPAFDWDLIIDVGDWTASQHPPSEEEGIALVKCLDETFGKDRGLFFTVAGNHDGEARGWKPGEFTQKYINPLGDAAYAITSNFEKKARPQQNDFRQVLEYPGSRWDRYLIRTGNAVWIMMGDRNEFDELALSRKDLTGQFQAGRGSAAGLPKGGYPSGSVTLDTFQWWKEVIEDPQFSNDILITVHHHMPKLTTITTEDGEPGQYHGKSGSMGPEGETGGQLYWIREYNKEGKEINQYAQTRPFLDYLKDHPGAIAAWIGGHSHIHTPHSEINGRGLQVKKYGVNFISIGALTDSHAQGVNQMSRMLTFEDGSDNALLNVYIHQSKDRHALGWDSTAVRKVALGKKFISPKNSKNKTKPLILPNVRYVSDAPSDPKASRYAWNLDDNQKYDFNSDKFIIGKDGSPYGTFEGNDASIYTTDTPVKKGKSLKLNTIKGGVNFNAPYTPIMNWNSATIQLWIKMANGTPQNILNSGNAQGFNKFTLKHDGKYLIWEVGTRDAKRVIQCKVDFTEYQHQWSQVTVIADDKRKRIQLYLNSELVAEKRWKSKGLPHLTQPEFILGDKRNNGKTADVLVYNLSIHDEVNLPVSGVVYFNH